MPETLRSSRQRLAQTLALLAAIVAATAAGYRYWISKNPDEVALGCADIVAGCEWPEHELQVRFDHHPSALKPARLMVAYPAQAETLYARFRMAGMEMGLNRYRLILQKNGVWQADVVLPICVQDRHDWQLILETAGGNYAIPFSTG